MVLMAERLMFQFFLEIYNKYFYNVSLSKGINIVLKVEREDGKKNIHDAPNFSICS